MPWPPFECFLFLPTTSNHQHIWWSQSWANRVNCNMITLLTTLIPNHHHIWGSQSCITFMGGILVGDSRRHQPLWFMRILVSQSHWISRNGSIIFLSRLLCQTLFRSIVCSLNAINWFLPPNRPIIYFTFRMRYWTMLMYIFLVVEVLYMVLIEVRNVSAAIGRQQIGREKTVYCWTSSSTCFKWWYVKFSSWCYISSGSSSFKFYQAH